MSELRIKEIDDLIGVLCRVNDNLILTERERGPGWKQLRKKQLVTIVDYSYEKLNNFYYGFCITLIGLNGNRAEKYIFDHYNKRFLIDEKDLPEKEINKIRNRITSMFIPFSRCVSGGNKKIRTIGTKYDEIKNQRNR